MDSGMRAPYSCAIAVIFEVRLGGRPCRSPCVRGVDLRSQAFM